LYGAALGTAMFRDQNSEATLVLDGPLYEQSLAQLGM
jgi:hypothetical protein